MPGLTNLLTQQSPSQEVMSKLLHLEQAVQQHTVILERPRVTEQTVQGIVIQEINEQTKIVNDNMKNNLAIQKQDFDGMIKRLGVNI